MRRHALFALSTIVPAAMSSASAIAQDLPLTPLDEVVMFGIDDDSRHLIRYEFGANRVFDLGTVRFPDGAVLTNLESLAHIRGQFHLLGVWNYQPGYASKLVQIDMLSGMATPLPNDTGFGNVQGLTVVERLNRGPGPDAPTTVILDDSKGVDAFEISFVDVTYNDDGTSSWTYRVRELPRGKDLSHWDLALCPTHRIMPGTTSGYSFGRDGSTGFYGIKWDVGDGFSDGLFTIVLDKHYGGTQGGNGVGVLAKGGNKADTGEIFGPTCDVPEQYTLYGVHSDSLGQKALVSIDPDTGVGEKQMDLSRDYESIAASHDGRLYALANNEVWLIDPFSDQELLVGDQPFQRVQGLEFAFGDAGPGILAPGVDSELTRYGMLFGYSDVHDRLMVVNPSTGEAADYGSLEGVHDLEGITFTTMSRDPRVALAAVAYD